LHFSRRSFLQGLSACTLLPSQAASLLAQHAMHSGMAAGTSAPLPHAARTQPPMLRTANLTPWVDPLPLPPRICGGKAPLHISMREVHAKTHRDVSATRFWTYVAEGSHENANAASLAPLIEARRGRTLHIDWKNELPEKHFLPVDFSLHGCGRDLPEVRAVAHLHGAKVPSASDGYPTDWYATGQGRRCTYPMDQEAATLWYHDHAMGLNRLNTYAGMFGMVLLRDEAEDALQLPKGDCELPLILADRFLTTNGELYYPDSGDPDHPWVPEFYAETLLVNNAISPFHTVEPRLYRLRILNAANSRFFNLAFSGEHAFHVISTDQGLLAKPVPAKQVLLAPAERVDLLVDFTSLAGQRVQLQNGFVPMLQFRVGGTAARSSTMTAVPQSLRTVPPPDAARAINTRTITLEEVQDRIQNPMLMVLNGKRWHEPVTETPRLDTTEIWEFVNLTEDTHPMHLHLVRFRILDRRSIDVFGYRNFKTLKFIAAAQPPSPTEDGWKDVVQCPAGMITRILVHFDGYAGKYLYHCHVLEHEANDMMRPFEVLA
jgi:spore coat protein A